MTPLRRLVATLGLGSALLLTSAGTAAAQNWSYADPIGDVVSHEDGGATTAPARAPGDVVRTTISHTRTKVVIRVRMRAVPRGDWTSSAMIRTPRAEFYLLQFKVDDYRGFSLVKLTGEGEVRCAGKSARIDRTALVLTVPRGCLGNPRWIRAGAGVSTFDGSIMADEEDLPPAYFDDGLRRALGGELRLSPRIKRG